MRQAIFFRFALIGMILPVLVRLVFSGVSSDSRIGDRDGVASLPVSAAAQSTTVCSMDVPQRLPPTGSRGTTLSTLIVSDDLIVGDVNVRLFISHTRDADLTVLLISPGGVQVELFAGVGGAGDNFGSTCAPLPNCVIDDQAVVNIAAGRGPFVGRFQSEGRVLGAFNGENARGTWMLTIIDDLPVGTGALQCWCLEIEAPR